MAAYDYKIEYLETSGVEYIDSLIVASGNTRIDYYFNVARLTSSRTLYGSQNISFFGFAATGRFESYYAIPYDTVLGTMYEVHFFAMDTSSGSRRGFVSINGTEIGTEWTSASKMSSYHILVGAVSKTTGDETEPILTHSSRIGPSKIVVDGTLVRDFIPVVKNGAACMYDTVSRNFFYNAGTGSFVAGPRIYEPVTTGLPMALAPFGGIGVVNPYIQNGLKMHLDGIWNSGIGVHTDSTSTWQDLAGNHDATVNEACTWGGSYLQNSSQVIPAVINGLSSVDFNTACTIEVVFARTARASRMIIFGNYITTYGRGYSIETFYGNGTNYNIRVFCSTSYASVDIDTLVPTSVDTAVSFGFVRNGNSSTMYGNGQQTKTGTFDKSPPAAEWRIGCDDSRTQFAFFGKLYAIRVYDRALTDAEISQNYNIDKQRFGI